MRMTRNNFDPRLVYAQLERREIADHDEALRLLEEACHAIAFDRERLADLKQRIADLAASAEK